MANKKITNKPNKKVTKMCAPYISRGHTLTSEWVVPSAMTTGTSARRATNLIINWKIGSEISHTVSSTVGVSTTSQELNLDRFVINRTTEYGRSHFYPLNVNNKLASVSITVKGKNSEGTGGGVTQTSNFELPDAPTIDEISLNANGVVSTTIRASESSGFKDRYDTAYTRTVYRSSNKSTLTTEEQYPTATEIAVSYDAHDYQSLNDKDYIKVTWTAYDRGYAGNSITESKSIYLAYPAKAVIGKPIVPEGASGSGDGYVTVPVDTKTSAEHPVYGVKLQYAKNTDYTDASQIPDSAFEDSGIEDNGDCTALTMPVSMFEAQRGKYSWVRVKSYGADENVLYKYSNYMWVEDIFEKAPSATAATVDVVSVVSGEDGESAIATLGWNKNGTDEYTGTEISWSDDKNAWKSTKDPEHYDFTWSDGQLTTGGVTYRDSAAITIMDLNRDTTYYVRARRYLEGDTTTYGAYSDPERPVTPTNKPSIVVARCNKTVATGKPLGVYWSFGGGGLQTRWRIADDNGHDLAVGDGSIGFGQIDAKTIADKAVNGVLQFKVYVTTGGGEKDGDLVKVNVVSQPTLSVAYAGNAISNDILIRNALSFTATVSRPCNLAVTVKSKGSAGDAPKGFDDQLEGDTVYTNEFSKDEMKWANGSTTITLPSTTDFRDKARYELHVTAIDPDYELRKDIKPKEFSVNWARKAANPVATITPVDEVVGENHIQGAQITLSPPTGAQDGDVYDIYRMDGSNAHLIGKGFPLTYDHLDEYAPIGGKAYVVSTDIEGYSAKNPSAENWYEYNSGDKIYFASTDETVNASKSYYEVEELYYRIAFRTSDGDVAFTDIPYAYPSDITRIDWQGGSLELPYGNTIADSYSKSVEFRQHMDGSVDGYWNKNIERKGSYSSAIIKLVQPNDVNMARALARYAGAVFVRTPNGSAYVADVQVTDLSVKNEAVTAIALDATEVDITEEFMLDNPYELEDE